MCIDGEEDNSEPCTPRICSGGEWHTVIMDCQEFLAPETCKSGIFIPAEEGECCSTCSEGKPSSKTSDGGRKEGRNEGTHGVFFEGGASRFISAPPSIAPLNATLNKIRIYCSQFS